MRDAGERAIGGVTSGVIGLKEETRRGGERAAPGVGGAGLGEFPCDFAGDKMQNTMDRMKATVALLLALPLWAQQPLGIFESRSDVGTVKQAGAAGYDAAARAYTVSASGENMWAAADAFHYVWKRVSGDISISADITFPSATGDPHKKAALVIRQSLDADSAYADVAVHGDGLTSLQTRDAKGAATHEIQSNVARPARVRITKDGDNFYIFVGAVGEDLRFAGGAMRVPLTGPFYIGLAVCAHNTDALETAIFSNVEITPVAGEARHYSTLETMTVSSTDRRVVYVAEEPLPNPPSWSFDGAALSFFNAGRAFEVPVGGGRVTDQGPASSSIERGLSSASPDGRRIMTLVGNELQLNYDASVTTLAKFPGGATAAVWSPDGRRVAFISYQSIR